MTIAGYEKDDPIPIATFAQQPQISRTVDCLRKWHHQGNQNRFTKERVKLAMSRTPGGGLAVSITQYETFVAQLNEKP